MSEINPNSVLLALWRTMPDSRSRIHTRNLTVRLPSWVDPDHPIVARELKALPPVPAWRGGLRGRGLMAALMLLMTPLACLLGNVPIHLALVPLSWLPLIWATPVISRERRDRTWDVLRMTPYTARTIVLAKLSAVLHHLAPLLGFIMVGQIASLAVLGLFSLDLTYGSGSIGIDGEAVQRISPADPGVPVGALAIGGVVIALMLLTPVLDYLLNVTLGLFVSTLTASVSLAYVGAFCLRLVLAAGFVVVGLATAGLATGQRVNLPIVFGAASVVGSPGWTMMLLPAQAEAALGVALALLAAQVSVLLTALGATLWRTERLQ